MEETRRAETREEALAALRRQEAAARADAEYYAQVRRYDLAWHAHTRAVVAAGQRRLIESTGGGYAG